MSVQLVEPQTQRQRLNEFWQLAHQPPKGVVREFTDFLLQNKKWWLIPIVMAMFLVGLMATLGSTAAAPFVYSLY